MTWINTISYHEASGKLRKLYDRVKGPDDNVDNIMMAHSLRPHSMEGHMAIYKYVLHHSANSLSKWFLETVGVYVSQLNGCDYCVDHHSAGLRRLLNDDARYNTIMSSIVSDDVSRSGLSTLEIAYLSYARLVALTPNQLTEADIQTLRDTGASDGEILEVNQVTAYFCYANRTVLGLGINTAGDVLGLSPNDSDDPNNWSHR